MDKYTSNKVNMFGSVSITLTDYNDTVRSVPMLDAYFTTLKADVKIVKDLSAKVALSNTGIAVDKKVLWQQLAAALNRIASALRAYAIDLKDNTLRNQAAFSPSGFTQLPCADAVTTATALLDLAEAHLAGLGLYNIVQADITDARKLKDDLDAANARPVNKITSNKTLNAELFAAVRKANDLLRFQMDVLMNTLRYSNPQFFTDYMNARKMRNPGLRHETVPGPESAQPSASRDSAPLAASQEAAQPSAGREVAQPSASPESAPLAASPEQPNEEAQAPAEGPATPMQDGPVKEPAANASDAVGDGGGVPEEGVG